MSASGRPVSDALRQLLSAPPSDPALVQAFANGPAITRRAHHNGLRNVSRATRGVIQDKSRKWQRTSDRSASMARKRKLGSSGSLPVDLREHYTEGERAALTVIAGEIKQHGICELAIDHIAAVSGISRTTVHNAVRKAQRLMHVIVQARPRAGRKSLTNRVKVISKAWLSWIKRAPALAKSIGLKLFHPTKRIVKKERKEEQFSPKLTCVAPPTKPQTYERLRYGNH